MPERRSLDAKRESRMMIPSSLPNFEIPTGLMGTGLRGLRGFGRGLGQVSVQAIAQAQFLGQISPSFMPTQYFTAGYSTTPQALPTYLYATSDFAGQIASLLGGSVVSAPPPGNYQGTNIPNALWVQLSDGSMVLPGNLMQAGTVLSFEDECDAENYFASSIPGGQLSSTCSGGGTGLTPSQISNPPVTTTPVTTTPVSTTPIVTTPVSVSQPTAAPVTFTLSDTCSTAQAKIAALQAAGQSNVVIWNQIPSSLAMCSVVEALNPSASIYDPATSGSGSQPGSVNSGSGNSGATGNTSSTSSTGATSTSNTGLYIGIGAAILIGIMALSKD